MQRLRTLSGRRTSTYDFVGEDRRGGNGADTLYSPVSARAIAQRGIVLVSIENVVVVPAGNGVCL